MTCRYDRDKREYLTPEGDPCRRDEYGDPTRHCRHRRSCAQHVGPRELTCARCIARVRQDVRAIADLAPLAMVEALGDGINSEAAHIAGRATDPRLWSARRIAVLSHLLAWNAHGRISELQYWHARVLVEDDDETHPERLLTGWHLAIAEDYHDPLPDRMTLTRAAAYLDRKLHTIAQDPEQDFQLLGSQMRDCRQHLEAVIHNSSSPERGEHCPDCAEGLEPKYVRLRREYGHWCTDPDCERFHYTTEDGDRWVCPRNRLHWWTAEGYAQLLEERKAERTA